MNCQDFENQIALYVNHDLPTAEIPVLERHLAKCADCRQFAAEMRECNRSVHLLAADDFDDATYARVRHNVMVRVGMQEPRLGFWQRFWAVPVFRYALAFSLLALLALPGLFLLKSGTPATKQAGIVKPQPHNDAITSSVAPREAREAGDPIPAQPTRTNRPVAGPKPVKPVQPAIQPKNDPVEMAVTNPFNSEPNGATADAKPIRLEIPTADPNIRIIWFSQNAVENPNPTT